MIKDDTLLLYYGGELESAEHERVAQALKQDADLEKRYQSLVEDLGVLQTLPIVEAPDTASAAWHRAIKEEAAKKPLFSRNWWQPLSIAIAASMVLAIGVVIGLQLNSGANREVAPLAGVQTETANGIERPYNKGPAGSPQPADNTDPRIQKAAFSRGLVDYMQTAREQLGTLPAGDDDRSAIIAQLINNNRSFERIAENLAEDDIARVLRAFDQVLQQLAQAQNEPSTLEQDIDRLSFEYGAMLTQFESRASNPYTL